MEEAPEGHKTKCESVFGEIKQEDRKGGEREQERERRAETHLQDEKRAGERCVAPE